MRIGGLELLGSRTLCAYWEDGLGISGWHRVDHGWEGTVTSFTLSVFVSKATRPTHHVVSECTLGDGNGKDAQGADRGQDAHLTTDEGRHPSLRCRYGTAAK